MTKWRERFQTLQIPSWVPDNVQSLVVRDGWGVRSGEPEIIALTERLLTDPRMEKVWHELLRKNRKTGDYLHLPDNMKRMPGSDRANEVHATGMAIVFMDVVRIGGAVLQISAQKSMDYFERAYRLRGDAGFLRRMNKEHRLGNDAREVSKLTKDLERAADAYNRLSELSGLKFKGSRLFDDSQLVAKLFAAEMAKKMRGAYGDPLYGTIATLAQVALKDDNITRDAVVEWCRHHGER